MSDYDISKATSIFASITFNNPVANYLRKREEDVVRIITVLGKPQLTYPIVSYACDVINLEPIEVYALLCANSQYDIMKKFHEALKHEQTPT